MRVFLFIFLAFLSSCNSNVKNTWTCPTPEGGRGNCLSIKEADLEVGNPNNKNSPTFLNNNQKIEINLIAPKLKDLRKLREEDPSIIHETEIKSKLRTPEKVGRVWFAPYIDAEGNQHSEYTVFVVDEEAKWLIQK